MAEIEGLRVLGTPDSLSHRLHPEVEDVQCAIVHPGDRLDALEAFAVVLMSRGDRVMDMR